MHAMTFSPPELFPTAGISIWRDHAFGYEITLQNVRDYFMRSPMHRGGSNNAMLGPVLPYRLWQPDFLAGVIAFYL